MKALHLGAVVDLRDLARSPGGDALDRFHYFANRAVWKHQSQTFRGLGKLVARSLAWPVLSVVAAAQCVAKYGPLVRRKTGLGLLSQWKQQYALSLKHRLAPHYYYQYQLYNAGRLEQARKFVTHHQGIALIPTLNQGRDPWDKREFARSCVANGLPHVASIATLEPSQSVPPIRGKDLPSIDLIVKPVDSGCGKGVERWLWAGDVFQCDGGKAFSPDQLIDHVFRLSRTSPYIIQPRLKNHADIVPISSGALSTIRMITGLANGGNEPVYILATFRMGVGLGPVDNFHAGGIGSFIDVTTGQLGPAAGADPNQWSIDQHPDTGNTITGRTIPKFREAVELAKQAHRFFPSEAIIGWDIAVTPDGPVFVEANYSPAVAVQAAPDSVPLLETDFIRVALSYLDFAGGSNAVRQEERPGAGERLSTVKT